MGTIIERLLDLLTDWIGYLVCWYICEEDEIGIVQRIGMYKRDLKPGWNWKWPIVETTTTVSRALCSTVLEEQTLTTKDGHSVTVRGILTYRVNNARRFLLDVEDAESVINDVGCSVVAECVPRANLEEVMTGARFAKDLRKCMRSRGCKWGIRVITFALMDRVKSRCYRIIGMS